MTYHTVVGRHGSVHAQYDHSPLTFMMFFNILSSRDRMHLGGPENGGFRLEGMISLLAV